MQTQRAMISTTGGGCIFIARSSSRHARFSPSAASFADCCISVSPNRSSWVFWATSRAASFFLRRASAAWSRPLIFDIRVDLSMADQLLLRRLAGRRRAQHQLQFSSRSFRFVGYSAR